MIAITMHALTSRTQRVGGSVIGSIHYWHLRHRVGLLERALRRVRRETQACSPFASVFELEVLLHRERVTIVELAVSCTHLAYLRKCAPVQSKLLRSIS